MKTASKCLARRKGYWDLEFEPSVEEIVDYRLIYIIYGDFLSLLSLVSSHSGGISLFSLAHGSGGHVRVNRLKPCAPILLYTEHAQFVDVS